MAIKFIKQTHSVRNAEQNYNEIMAIRQDVLSVLTKSNWIPNEKKDISDILEDWKQKNYAVSEYQIEFIANFAFLKLNFHNHSIVINPVNNYDADNDVLKIYEAYFHISLIPVGFMRGPDTELFIGNIGYLYGCWEECACVLGKNFFEFLENLLDEKVIFDVIDNFYE